MKTTEEVLEWVADTTVGRLPFEPEEFAKKRIAKYTETAARIARAMAWWERAERHWDSCQLTVCAICTGLDALDEHIATAEEGAERREAAREKLRDMGSPPSTVLAAGDDHETE